VAGMGVIFACVVLFESRSSWPLYSPIHAHFDFAVRVVVKWRGGLIRAYGPMGEATQMGCVLVISFAAALAARRSFISNTAYIAVVSIIALGSLAPQSRGGMIGLAYAGATLFGSMGSQISTSLTEAASGDYRSNLLRRGMEEFWKSPIFGDNYNNVTARMQDMVQGEGFVDFVNTYLYFALFAGAIGLVLFCASFILPITRLFQIRRQLPPESDAREVAGFCLALLMSAAVMLAFTAYMQRPSIYFLIAASLAMMIRVPSRAGNPKKPVDLRVRSPDGPLTA
jgi:O-antigen ligase